jgi:aspartyl aminopeptidase
VSTPRDTIDGLLRFIDASPSPYHAVATAAERLEAVGFGRLERTDSWESGSGRWFVTDGGALVAWVQGSIIPSAPFRIVGAHTDSPNLRVKARPDTGRAGWRQVGVEVYGGVLVNSWLDRDLGLSGRVTLREPSAPSGFTTMLLQVDRPILRVPQLAIHLDREINERGLQLNKQTHLVPVWGLGQPTDGDLQSFVATELGVAPSAILGWDLMLHDLVPSTVGGLEHDLVFAPRLDNLCSCSVAVDALCGFTADDSTVVPVVSLFDHEEVGSESATGAAGALLGQVLERIVSSNGGDRTDLLRALAGSVCVSADMAHATHPNYVERHEPDHEAHTGDLADKLGLSPGTVTTTIKRLADRGLVDHTPYQGVELTETGSGHRPWPHPPPPHRRALPRRHARLRLERGRPPRRGLRARAARGGRGPPLRGPRPARATCPHGFPIPAPRSPSIPATAAALRPRARRRRRGRRARLDRPRGRRLPRPARACAPAAGSGRRSTPSTARSCSSSKGRRSHRTLGATVANQVFVQRASPDHRP